GGRLSRGASGLRAHGPLPELPGPGRGGPGRGGARGPLAAGVGRDRVPRAGRDAVDRGVGEAGAPRRGGEHVRAAGAQAPGHRAGGRRAEMIAAELYTLREHLRDADAIAAGLGRVREMGYEGVELAGLGPIDAGRLGQLLRETSLVACSAHVRWERLRDEPDAVVEDCRTWGCSHVGGPVMPHGFRAGDGYARFARAAASGAAQV